MILVLLPLRALSGLFETSARLGGAAIWTLSCRVVHQWWRRLRWPNWPLGRGKGSLDGKSHHCSGVSCEGIEATPKSVFHENKIPLIVYPRLYFLPWSLSGYKHSGSMGWSNDRRLTMHQLPHFDVFNVFQVSSQAMGNQQPPLAVE